MMSFRKKCCDPLGLRKCSKTLISVRPSIRLKLEKLNVKGSFVCSSCNIKISNLKIPQTSSSTFGLNQFEISLNNNSFVDEMELESEDSEQELEEESAEGLKYEKTELINALNVNILPALRVSPITIKRMASKKYVVQKFEQLTGGLKRILGHDEDLAIPKELQLKAQQFDEFILQLKTKFKNAETKNEKYQILTLLPESWSARKIQAEFGCTFHMANSSKKLQRVKGVLSFPNPKLPSNILSIETKEIAETFYLEDDISRVMAGKNDCISMLVNGKKQKVQKRLMLGTLRQSYQELKNRHPTLKICLNYFVKCRPKNCVFLGSSGSHSICVCTIHQNVKQMLFSSRISKLTNGDIKHYEHCIAKVICNPPQQKCFMRTCKNCPKMQDFKKFLVNVLKKDKNVDTDEDEDRDEDEVQYDNEDVFCEDDIDADGIEKIEDQDDTDAENENDSEDDTDVDTDESDEESDDGNKSEHNNTNDEEVIHFRQWVSTDRCEFVHMAKTVPEFVNYFVLKLEKLITHSFTAREQMSFLNFLKQTLKVGEFLVCGDFSENFSFVLQNEAQSYYWSKKQATIHPFVIYYKNEKGELMHLSYVVISECLKHDSVAVHLFIKKLIKFLESRFKVISKLIYFTDGCSGQYKNRKNFLNLYFHHIDFGYEAEWHFHATAHAKGPYDGIGGTLKRTATRVSLSRTFENQIDTAELLFEWASSSNMQMNFEYSTTAEYKSTATELKERFDAATTIKGTLKYHCFIPKQNGEMLVKLFSHDEDYKIVKILN